MARTPHVRYLRERHFRRLRHSDVFLPWLAAVGAKIGETAHTVFDVMKSHQYSARQVNAMVTAGDTAPVNTVAPAITGTATVGQTLTSTTGTWTGTPTPTYVRQWLRDGVAIAGATAATYVLVTADATHSITVKVTATNILGAVSATSTAVGPVAAS
jgi:hypothetical protein